MWQTTEAPWGIDTADEFISWMQPFLFDTSNGSVNDHTGAATYVITAMLGYAGPDFGGNFLTGVNTARAEWADWQQLVRDYDNAGYINWNDMVTYCYPYEQANLDYIVHDLYYFNNIYGSGCTVDDTITFANPITGDIFRIKKACGNPVFDNTPLTAVDSSVSLGNFVWFDSNNDGIVNGSEATQGVNGVTVNLYDNAADTNSDGSLSAAEVTAATPVETTTTANDPRAGATNGRPGYYSLMI